MTPFNMSRALFEELVYEHGVCFVDFCEIDEFPPLALLQVHWYHHGEQNKTISSLLNCAIKFSLERIFSFSKMLFKMPRNRFSSICSYIYSSLFENRYSKYLTLMMLPPSMLETLDPETLTVGATLGLMSSNSNIVKTLDSVILSSNDSPEK